MGSQTTSHPIAKYLTIWELEGFVQIPLECWIKIFLKPGWEAKVFAIKVDVYALGNEASQLVDKIFDKIHSLVRLKFTTNHTSFRFLVLDVWNADAESKKKGQAVVNIQKLNKIPLPASYPLLLQLKIIDNLQ